MTDERCKPCGYHTLPKLECNHTKLAVCHEGLTELKEMLKREISYEIGCDQYGYNGANCDATIERVFKKFIDG